MLLMLNMHSHIPGTRVLKDFRDGPCWTNNDILKPLALENGFYGRDDCSCDNDTIWTREDQVWKVLAIYAQPAIFAVG